MAASMGDAIASEGRMTKRSATRRLGKEWGSLAYRATHAPKGERNRKARELQRYVIERLRGELRALAPGR